MNASKNIYVFSRHKFERYIIDYLDKVALIVVVVAYVAEIFYGNPMRQPVRWFTTLAILLTLIYLFGLIFRRFAYRISFDPSTKHYAFSMFRKKGTISVSLQDIERIKVNFFVMFQFHGKKVFYTGVDDRQLIDFLNSQGKTSGGAFWNLTSKRRNKK